MKAKTITHLALMLLSFLIAFALAAMPLPEWGRWLRPQWLALVVVYWTLYEPKYMGVILAWFLGLIQDVLMGAFLGQYALALVVIAYIASIMRERLRFSSIGQQFIFIIALVTLVQLTVYWIHSITGWKQHSFLYWLSILISGLCWPLVKISLNLVRKKYRLA